MIASSTLDTARLRGTRLQPDDFPDLRALHTDPHVMATLSTDGAILPEEMTRRSLDRALRHWDEYGYGRWMFRARDSGSLIGYAGLSPIELDGARDIELSYAVASAFWRQGYATEMSRAVLACGFEQVGLSTIIAITLPWNRSSRGVMERCGFAYERDTVHAGLPHVLYRLSAAQWQAAAMSDS